MDIARLGPEANGRLVDIAGPGEELDSGWKHKAFVPAPLGAEVPELSPVTFLQVAEARAALAALDSTAKRLPNPALLRTPALQREAQSTSALEGTYAPLGEVLTADAGGPRSLELTEILNYVHMANAAFDALADGYPLTVTFLAELQGILMTTTPLEAVSGTIRDSQVVIGIREDAPVSGHRIHAAEFVPAPPGPLLTDGIEDLVAWMRDDHAGTIDPVVAAAMSHYQFETLHPFRDGNGRVGRLLIVLQLTMTGALSEPTLTVSPWFEARRREYYAALMAVSAAGDWDSYIRFFAAGLAQAASRTHTQMLDLVEVQAQLREEVVTAGFRSQNALAVVDIAVANPTFTVATVKDELALAASGASRIVTQLVDPGILSVVDPGAYRKRYFAPRVLDVLLRDSR
ncbi:Fic family protein [Brevibacterium salitolerans]|uniref:Fic family protein n=1 Tax=Brevibacterium salitolerans TaxID=1403566 RepID=A0ABN2X349_9MICO